MRPMLPILNSANQRLPSGPTVRPSGRLLCVGMGNAVKLPLVVRRPILLPARSVNHRLPSGPAVISWGWQPFVDRQSFFGKGNSMMAPLGVMRPILFPSRSVNHMLPSGPAVMP